MRALSFSLSHSLTHLSFSMQTKPLTKYALHLRLCVSLHCSLSLVHCNIINNIINQVLTRMWIPISHICVRSFRCLSPGSILSRSFAHSHLNCIAADQRVCQFVTHLRISHHSFHSVTFPQEFCHEKHWNFAFRWDSHQRVLYSSVDLGGKSNNANQCRNAFDSTQRWKWNEKKCELRTSRSEGRIITSRTPKIMLDVSVNNKWSSFLNWHFQFNSHHIHHLKHDQ